MAPIGVVEKKMEATIRGFGLGVSWRLNQVRL